MIYPRIVSEFPVQVKVIDCFLYKFFLMVLCERGALLLVATLAGLYGIIIRV